MKFAVRSTEDEEIAYISDEEGSVRIQLTKPADFQHAWRVAEFLSANIHAIAVDGAGETAPSQRSAYADR